MTLKSRDKRALLLLAVAGTLMLVWNIASTDEELPAAAQAPESVPLAEQQLVKLRRVAASVPGKDELVKQAKAELDLREQGLIQAETAAQAQARLLQILERAGRQLEEPIDIGSTEIGQIRPFGDEYGEVSVSVSFSARIEQLINFLSDLSAHKELIATSEMRIGEGNPKHKAMPVRLTITGLVRRELVPEKKGLASF